MTSKTGEADSPAVGCSGAARRATLEISGYAKLLDGFGAGPLDNACHGTDAAGTAVDGGIDAPPSDSAPRMLWGWLDDGETQSRFIRLSRQPVAMTPMPAATHGDVFQGEDHRLSKQEICDALWPASPTPARRFTPRQATHSRGGGLGGMRIVSDRRQGLRLQED
jgi:hypothetical protein